MLATPSCPAPNAVTATVGVTSASTRENKSTKAARISGDHPGIDSRILERTLKPIAFIEQAAAVAHKTGDELADCDTDYRDVIAAGRSYTGVDYVEAGYRRTQMRAAFVDLFSRVDALVTPTVAVTAFGAGQLGVASIDGTP
ncbi:MAG: hypothetical protein ACK5BX_18550, partial [Bradyrhizobium sp.]